MCGAAATFNYVFDYKPDDIFWCTADCGWITGGQGGLGWAGLGWAALRWAALRWAGLGCAGREASVCAGVCRSRSLTPNHAPVPASTLLQATAT